MENNLEQIEGHLENVYAKNVKGEFIYVLDVQNGRNGYYCIGCDMEMIAIHRKVISYKPYFRHYYPIDFDGVKCGTSETHRHLIAKDLIYLSKQIKVPKLLKYHPTDHNAPAYILKHEELINTARVEREMPFFENEYGEIQYGRNTGVTEKNILIKPDLTFFDKDDKPFLFIEIVATHKINDEKKAKIRRIGINTLEITIPKDSPKAIEESLKSTIKSKWIFHNEEAQSNYFQLSESNTETVSHIDAEQRKLLGETFACRQAEIRQLVSGIRKCLQSEQYNRTRELLDSEIARVKGFTEKQREGLLEYEEECRINIAREIEPEEERIEEEIRISEELFRRNRIRRKDLVGRYNKKREELDTDINRIEKETRDFDIRGNREAGNIEIEIGRVDEAIGKEEQFIGDIAAEISRISSEYDNLESVYRRKLRTDKDEVNRNIRRAEEESRTILSKQSRLPEEFDAKERRIIEESERDQKKFETEFRTEQSKLREGFERRVEDIKSSFATRNTERNDEGAQAVLNIIHGSEHLAALCAKQQPYERVRKASESIRNGTYKDILERYG